MSGLQWFSVKERTPEDGRILGVVGGYAHSFLVLGGRFYDTYAGGLMEIANVAFWTPMPAFPTGNGVAKRKYRVAVGDMAFTLEAESAGAALASVSTYLHSDTNPNGVPTGPVAVEEVPSDAMRGENGKDAEIAMLRRLLPPSLLREVDSRLARRDALRGEKG